MLLGCRWSRIDGEGDGLRIEVKDNGPGIAADKQAVIFDEFVRLQPEDNQPREERGLGLGLAIVERIARMLGLPARLGRAGEGVDFLGDGAALCRRGVVRCRTDPSAAPRRRLPMPAAS